MFSAVLLCYHYKHILGHTSVNLVTLLKVSFGEGHGDLHFSPMTFISWSSDFALYLYLMEKCHT